MTAFATSETSARVGDGELIIDSSICVAVMHDLVARAREPDQALLQTRHRRVADLDREIAARHHDHVARVDDRADVLHGLGALDLRDDVRLPARGAQQRARLLDVLGIARERHRHEVEPEPRGRLDVAPVLVRERGRGQAAALLVEALVIAELAALLHAARDARALDALRPRARSGRRRAARRRPAPRP